MSALRAIKKLRKKSTKTNAKIFPTGYCVKHEILCVSIEFVKARPFKTAVMSLPPQPEVLCLQDCIYTAQKERKKNAINFN